MKFRDIVSLEDDYEVAKAKATIAIATVAWLAELEFFIRRFK